MNIKELLGTTEWCQIYKWSENPFTLKININSEAFVTLEDISITLIDHTKSGGITNVVGSPGIGKTELAMQLVRALQKHNYKVAYIDLSGTDMQITTFIGMIIKQIPPGWLRKLRKNDIDTLIDHLNRVGRKHKVALIIDEAQNISNTTIADGIRKISDSCENVSTILFSLQNLVDTTPFRESLRRRVRTVQMRGMTLSEATELIARRIKLAGGVGIYPFTDEVISFLWRRSNKIPGVILQHCEELCRRNAREGTGGNIWLDYALTVFKERLPTPPVEKKIVEKIAIPKAPEEPSIPKTPLPLQAKQILSSLSEQQQEILLLAKDQPTFRIEQLASKLGTEYFSISTQMRRINKKLGGNVFVLARKEGKNKIWKLADNYKLLFSKG